MGEGNIGIEARTGRVKALRIRNHDMPASVQHPATLQIDHLVGLQRHAGRRSRVNPIEQGYRLRRLVDNRLGCGRGYLRSVPIAKGHARILEDGPSTALRTFALVGAGQQIVIDLVVDLLNETDRTLRSPLSGDLQDDRGRRGARSCRRGGRRRGRRLWAAVDCTRSARACRSPRGGTRAASSRDRRVLGAC